VDITLALDAAMALALLVFSEFSLLAGGTQFSSMFITKLRPQLRSNLRSETNLGTQILAARLLVSKKTYADRTANPDLHKRTRTAVAVLVTWVEMTNYLIPNPS
jgi:hypothetical protein